MRWLTDLFRGGLIGTAEIIPGVSGGTVALIVGVYNTLIDSASAIVRGVVGVVIPRARGRSHSWAEVSWQRIIPILVGMFAAIFIAARFLEPLLEAFPAESRAVFAGAIAMSLIVPISMVGRHWRWREVALAAVAAALSFALVSLPGVGADSSGLILVAPAAALAVCALVLPGVSGSFLLLTLGMYEPTLRAVNDRDWLYLAVFAAGAVVGLSSFVLVLQWLLAHRRRITLVVMTGLMVGSLRALWPWQSPSREALAPTPGTELTMALLFLAGVVVVATLLFLERRVFSTTAGA
jgi:putative membrane protein